MLNMFSLMRFQCFRQGSRQKKLFSLVTRSLRKGGGKVGPLRKRTFLKLEKKYSEKNVTTKLKEGGRALVVKPLKE